MAGKFFVDPDGRIWNKAPRISSDTMLWERLEGHGPDDGNPPHGLYWVPTSSDRPPNLRPLKRPYGPMDYLRPPPGVELQTCPSRAGTTMQAENIDYWRKDRWTADEDLTSNDCPRWNSDWGPEPETCSFCCGLRPADTLRLVKDGWDHVGMMGVRNFYLQPKGYRGYLNSLFLFSEQLGYSGNTKPKHSGAPFPPVKVNTAHFTPEQLNELNVLLEERN